jgi:hypothetical protein
MAMLFGGRDLLGDEFPRFDIRCVESLRCPFCPSAFPSRTTHLNPSHLSQSPSRSSPLLLLLSSSGRSMHYRPIMELGLGVKHFELWVNHFRETLEEIGGIPEETKVGAVRG